MKHIWEYQDTHIFDKFTNNKYYYNNPKDMEYLTEYLNHTTNDNMNLSSDYKSLIITKNIIKEKLKDYQRIALKYNLKSSTEMEWLLDKIFQEKPELKKEIEIKHMKEYYHMGDD